MRQGHRVQKSDLEEDKNDLRNSSSQMMSSKKKQSRCSSNIKGKNEPCFEDKKESKYLLSST
jgi:hypothetical protein